MNILQKIFSVKNEKTEKEKIYKVITILGLKIKYRYISKEFGSFSYNQDSFKNIKNSIVPDKKNFLYFDWFFGGYVFDEMKVANYENINLIRFSLFDIFNITTRARLINYIEYYEDKINKLFQKEFCNMNIDGLLVTHDWLKMQQKIINIFQSMNIKVVNILHEGVFQNEKLYYDSKSPVSDLVLTWGEMQKRIFSERGFSEEKIIPIGSIKLNSYKNFVPSITRDEFFKLLNLSSHKKTILYCCQLCDNQWIDQNLALENQRRMITDLVSIAKEHDYNLIIRNAPAMPEKIIPISFTEQYENDSNVVFEGRDEARINKSTYLTKPSDNIYYSDLVIGMNTTMQVEASLLNKPVLIAKYFEFDTKWNRELGLPVAENKDSLENLINRYIDYTENLIDSKKKEQFYSDYGYKEDLNYLPLKNIENILTNLDEYIKSTKKV